MGFSRQEYWSGVPLPSPVLVSALWQIYPLFFRISFLFRLGFLGGSAIKNPPTMREPQEMWAQSLGREDPLEKGTTTHSSILAWRFPWTEEPDGLQSMRSQRIGHDWSDLAQHGTHLGYHRAVTYTSNKSSERELKKTISFTVISKRIKYLRINLIKKVKDLYMKNLRYWLEKLKKTQINGKAFCIHGLEVRLFKCPYLI